MSKDIISGANINKAGVYPGWKMKKAAPGGVQSVEVTPIVEEGTKIASIVVDGEGTDLYAPGKEDLVIELHYVNEDLSSLGQPTVTISETPATVVSALLAGKDIKAKLFFAQSEPEYEYRLMLNGFMAVEFEVDGDYLPEIDFSFIYNDDGSMVSDNDFLAKVIIGQEDNETWAAPTVYKYDLQEFTSQE